MADWAKAVWLFLYSAFLPIKWVAEWRGMLGLVVSFLLVCGVVTGTGIVGWRMPLPSHTVEFTHSDGTRHEVTASAPRWVFVAGLPATTLAVLFFIAGVKNQRLFNQPPGQLIGKVKTRLRVLAEEAYTLNEQRDEVPTDAIWDWYGRTCDFLRTALIGPYETMFRREAGEFTPGHQSAFRNHPHQMLGSRAGKLIAFANQVTEGELNPKVQLKD